MTTVKAASAALDKEGVFAAQNAVSKTFTGSTAAYAVPFISDEAKFAASEAARKAAAKPAAPKL